jgi:hypothetical protein
MSSLFFDVLYLYNLRGTFIAPVGVIMETFSASYKTSCALDTRQMEVQTPVFWPALPRIAGPHDALRSFLEIEVP